MADCHYEVRAWLTPAACSLCRWWPELQWRIRQRLCCVPSLSGGLRHVFRSWAGGSPGLAPGTWGRTTHPFYSLCFNRQRFLLFLPLRWRLWGLALWGEAGVIVVVQPPGRWHLAEARVGFPPAKQSFHLHSFPQKREKAYTRLCPGLPAEVMDTKTTNSKIRFLLTLLNT